MTNLIVSGQCCKSSVLDTFPASAPLRAKSLGRWGCHGLNAPSATT